MAGVVYLWKNRAKFPLNSGLFYRSWAKRLLLLPAVIGRNWKRFRLEIKGADIHPLAEIGRVRIEGHKCHLKIGKLSFLGRVHITLHEEVIIGERVCINDDVDLITASHDVSDPEWKHVKDKIIIEDYAWIGTGAMILPGVTIGKGAIVAARAVVSKDVLPFTIVAGVPAVPSKKKRVEALNYNPCEFLAENRAWLIG
jgi:acetyltransferase-like isoleucine patch superfamily enzyme